MRAGIVGELTHKIHGSLLRYFYFGLLVAVHIRDRFSHTARCIDENYSSNALLRGRRTALLAERLESGFVTGMGVDTVDDGGSDLSQALAMATVTTSTKTKLRSPRKPSGPLISVPEETR
jgi:hypothetical protein